MCTRTLILCGIILMMIGTLFAQIEIWTAEDLDNVRNDLSEGYIQMADIDLGIPPWNTGEGWVPLGNDNTPFTGVYNGNDFLITGLTINRSGFGNQNQGLFGCIEDATLQNISLENVGIQAHSYVGAIAGLSETSTITNCIIDGSVTGSSNRVGGLVGYIDFSAIENCHVSGTVTGWEYIGGLAGYCTNFSSIEGSIFTGNIVGSWNNIGGICGYNIGSSSIYETFAQGSINGNSNVGGMAGFNLGFISDSFAAADVLGNNYIGGLIGANYGDLTNCFSIGSVQPGTSSGGLIGHGSGATIINSYWDVDTSGQTTSAGGEGRTTAEMTWPYADNTYVNWDFDFTWFADEDYILNDGYPVLRWVLAEITVAMPGSEPPGDVYYEPQMVSLFCETDDAEIRYTTDGTEPDEESYLYDEPILIEYSTILKAKAFKDDWFPSETMLQEYIILYPPLNLYAEITIGFVGLFWDEPALPRVRQELLSYNIYRSEDGNDFELIGSISADFHSYLDEDPEPGEYQYYVTAYYDEGESSPSNIITVIVPQAVATPYFLPESGYYDEAIEIEIFTETDNAEIFFTLDGSEPDSTSFLYTVPVTIDSTLTVKARAYKEGWFPSNIAVAEYEIDPVSCSPDIIDYSTKLYANYPNPFNPKTTISFTLKDRQAVRLDIFNVKGQLVANLVDDIMDAGGHSILWNPRPEKKRDIGSGFYFYRLETKDTQQTLKMLYLK